MRIVLDTNVYLSNFIFGGFTAKVCQICFESHQIFISDFIKREILNILVYKFQYPIVKTNYVMTIISKFTTEVEPSNNLPLACRDEDDNYILQLCQFIDAEYLITGDKDLLILVNFDNTKIMNPREFFDIIQTK